MKLAAFVFSLLSVGLLAEPGNDDGYNIQPLATGQVTLQQQEWLSITTEYAYLEISLDLEPLERSLDALKSSCGLLLIASTHANASTAIQTEAGRRHTRCRNTANRINRKYANLQHFIPKVRIMTDLEAEFNKYRDSATPIARGKRFIVSAAIFGAAAVGGLLTHTIESWLGGDDQLRHQVEADEVFLRNIAHHLEDTETLIRQIALQVGSEFDELLLFETIDILVSDAADTATWILQSVGAAVEQSKLPVNLIDGPRLLHELDVMRIRFLDQGRTLATTQLEELRDLPLLMALQRKGEQKHLCFCILMPTAKKAELLRIYAPKYPVVLVNKRPYILDKVETTLLAVKEDQSGFALTTKEDLRRCQQVEDTFYCPAVGLIRTDFTQTCLSAIWAKEAEAITERCSLHPLNPAQTYIKGLNSTSFLYIDTENVAPIKVFCGKRIILGTLPQGVSVLTTINCTVRGTGFVFQGMGNPAEVENEQLKLDIDLQQSQVHRIPNSLNLPAFESLPVLEPILPHAHRAANSLLLAGIILLAVIILLGYLYTRYHERLNLPKPEVASLMRQWENLRRRNPTIPEGNAPPNAPLADPGDVSRRSGSGTPRRIPDTLDPPSYSHLREEVRQSATPDQPLIPPGPENDAGRHRGVEPFNARNHGF